MARPEDLRRIYPTKVTPSYFGNAFNPAPTPDVFGRAPATPKAIIDYREQMRINNLQQDVFISRKEKRKDQAISFESDVNCSTTKRQTRRVDQRKYRNRPPNKIHGHR